MTVVEFESGIRRLSEQFGKNSYSQARMEVIWREIKDFSGAWWNKTVNHFLFTCRQAPIFADFAEPVALERERLNQYQKAIHRQDAKEFWAGTYQPDDVRTICQMITRRIQNKISDSDYTNFVQHLDEAAKGSNPCCSSCENTGLVFVRDSQNYDWPYRCFCSLGDKQNRQPPRFQRNSEGKVYEFKNKQ